MRRIIWYLYTRIICSKYPHRQQFAAHLCLRYTKRTTEYLDFAHSVFKDYTLSAQRQSTSVVCKPTLVIRTIDCIIIYFMVVTFLCIIHGWLTEHQSNWTEEFLVWLFITKVKTNLSPSISQTAWYYWLLANWVSQSSVDRNILNKSVTMMVHLNEPNKHVADICYP